MTGKLLSQDKYSTIIETDDFNDGVVYLNKIKQTKKVLALLDLDETVLSYRHTLGTDRWFSLNYNAFIEQGISNAEAEKRTMETVFKVVDKTNEDDILLVDPRIPTYIKNLQNEGIPTFALTSRGFYIKNATINQLATLGINFNQGIYSDRQHLLSENGDSQYYNGHIFAAGKNKGELLFGTLESLKTQPQVVVMWEDKESNLDKVRSAIHIYNEKHIGESSSEPIQFYGIRYSKLDALRDNVDPHIIRIQKAYFDRILSDDHARAILHAENKKNREHYVQISQDSHDQVVLSLCKTKHYKLIKDLDPLLDEHSTCGKLRDFNGKQKLSSDFIYRKSEFKPLYEKLCQHGLVSQQNIVEMSNSFKGMFHHYNLRKRPQSSDVAGQEMKTTGLLHKYK